MLLSDGTLETDKLQGSLGKYTPIMLPLSNKWIIQAGRCLHPRSLRSYGGRTSGDLPTADEELPQSSGLFAVGRDVRVTGKSRSLFSKAVFGIQTPTSVGRLFIFAGCASVECSHQHATLPWSGPAQWGAGRWMNWTKLSSSAPRRSVSCGKGLSVLDLVPPCSPCITTNMVSPTSPTFGLRRKWRYATVAIARKLW